MKLIRAAAKTTGMIRLDGEVEILAAAGEGKGPRQFKVRAYNGGLLSVGFYSDPVVIDLAGLSPAKSVVANLHHERRAIVGHSTEIKNDGKRLDLAGVVSGTGAEAQEFLANHDNGFPWQASIEAQPVKMIEVEAGKTINVNGRDFTGPLYLAKKSKLYGIAFVPRGADENTTVSVAAQMKGTAMDFEKWVEALGFDDPSLITDKQKAALETKYDAEVKAAAKQPTRQGAEPVVAAPEFDLDEVKAAASEHMAEMEAKLAEHEGDISDKKKLAEIRAGGIKEARELKRKAIAERWPAHRLEVESVRATSQFELRLVQAKAPAGPAIISGGERDTSAPVIEAALCMSRAMPNVEKHFKPEVLEKAHKHYRNRLGLQETLIMAAAQNGYQCRHGERITSGNIKDVLKFAFPDVHAGFSTVSLSGILSNVATKELLTGYMGGDDSWRAIAAIKTVSDFKQMTSYRMLDSMEYEQLGPAGEIEHGSLGSESYTRQADTFAKMFALTRRDIINDDLGAFDDLRNRLGSGAKKKFNNVFWTAFLANHSTFFTSTRRNYITGATTTLLADGVGLGLGVKAFRQMRTPNAEGSFTAEGSAPLGSNPSILLAPPELEYAAEVLHVSGNLATTAAVLNDNIYRNKYTPVISPWLSDSNFTGYSTTAWYLLRPPSEAPMMAVSFLNGVETPTVESAEADFNTLGVQFRGYHDFGCDQAEYLCGIKSKGAA